MIYKRKFCNQYIQRENKIYFISQKQIFLIPIFNSFKFINSLKNLKLFQNLQINDYFYPELICSSQSLSGQIINQLKIQIINYNKNQQFHVYAMRQT
ncbi:hypothetical protein pb186bvf_021022 [Paramecium bursaria]